MDSQWFRDEIDSLRALYRARGRGPRKQLGQNFLLDRNLLRAIVEDAAIERDDIVLEVGTGPGFLTALLASEARRVISVDKDAELLEFARGILKDYDNVRLLEADILESKKTLSPQVVEFFRRERERWGGRGRLVANLPYSVATPIILRVLRDLPEVESLVVMTQKELGERLSSSPGEKQYGPPRVLVELLAEIEVLRQVPPQVFWPRPKVDSVILRLTRRDRPLREPSCRERFERFVALVFSQRRKTLRANLRGVLSPKSGVEEPKWLDSWQARRAEELTAEELVDLFEAVNPFLT